MESFRLLSMFLWSSMQTGIVFFKIFIVHIWTSALCDNTIVALNKLM